MPSGTLALVCRSRILKRTSPSRGADGFAEAERATCSRLCVNVVEGFPPPAAVDVTSFEAVSCDRARAFFPSSALRPSARTFRW